METVVRSEEEGSDNLVNLHTLLSSVDDMDMIQLKYHLSRFLLSGVQDDGREQIRLQLKKSLLQEILKLEPENRSHHERFLQQIIQLLKRKQTGYECSLSGCRFKAARHRAYVSHLKLTHPRVENVKCNYQTVCIRVFAKIEDLIRHVKDDHSVVTTSVVNKDTVVPVDIPCKCVLHSCGSQHMCNSKELMTHYNTVHHSDNRECIFDDCDHKFPPGFNSRNHFRRKHISSNKMKLKAKHLVDPSAAGDSEPTLNFGDVQDEEEQFQSEITFDDRYDVFDIANLEEDDEGHDEETEEYFMEYYADYLNRLVNQKYIPQSTVHDICNEHYENSKRSQEIREKKLRASLSEIPNISVVQANKVIKNVIEDDFFLKVQEKLNTQHKRSKYIKENMQYVAPVEILLNKTEVENGAPKEVVHYIPLQDALKTLLEDKSVIKMFESERNSEKKGAITDIVDGSLYKDNPYFKENENAMGLLIYSDAVELKVISM